MFLGKRGVRVRAGDRGGRKRDLKQWRKGRDTVEQYYMVTVCAGIKHRGRERERESEERRGERERDTHTHTHTHTQTDTHTQQTDQQTHPETAKTERIVLTIKDSNKL